MSFSWSNAGKFFCNGTLKFRERRRKFCDHVLLKTCSYRRFHVVVGQGRRGSVRKNTCKIVVLPIQTYWFFCGSRCRRRRRCLSSLFVLFQDAVLVTGRSRLVLVSLKDGSLLASHSIPCEPLSPVAHGDFTNDGLMDFVVHCRARWVKSRP